VDPKEGEITADNSRLIVSKDLGFGQGLKLEGVLSALLASSEQEVQLDLSKVRHLCSSNLAVIASACNTLVSRGKTVKILALPQVARILRLGGVERIAHVEDVAE